MYLFMFSGVPGSGKSTLAKAVARHYQIPYFAKDTVQHFLYERGHITENTIDGYLWLLEQAKTQGELGIGCVLDAVFPKQGFRDETQQIAAQSGARFVPVYCYCSDKTLWKSRWMKRANSNSISHWMDFKWADVERIAEYFEEWTHPDVIRLDAVDSVEANVIKLVEQE